MLDVKFPNGKKKPKNKYTLQDRARLEVKGSTNMPCKYMYTYIIRVLNQMPLGPKESYAYYSKSEKTDIIIKMFSNVIA